MFNYVESMYKQVIKLHPHRGADCHVTKLRLQIHTGSHTFEKCPTIQLTEIFDQS